MHYVIQFDWGEGRGYKTDAKVVVEIKTADWTGKKEEGSERKRERRGDTKNMEQTRGKIDSYCDAEILFSIIYRIFLFPNHTEKKTFRFDPT